MNAIVQIQVRGGDGSPDATLLSAAVEASPESLAVIENGHIVYANRAFSQMFGFFLTSEVQGRALAELVPENGLSDVSRESTVGNETSGHGYPAFEFSGTRKDGTGMHIQASFAGFRVNGRDLLVINTRDISERKQAEQQLRESQKMEAIGRLVGGVAHDFNNLLTGIMLYCDLLIAGLGSDHRLRHHAEEIRMAGEHGAALIQQLLAVARQQVVEPRVLSWNEVISGTRGLLTRLIGENIELVTSLADDLGPVRIDPAQAQQVILNLALNARDAMPDGGRITLATRNCADCLSPSREQKPGLTPWVEFTVTDAGCGMDAETRSRLFEPFFTTKRPGQGNGLGLVTVHNIVKQEGGTLEVESEPGRGTRVSVRLPRVQEELEALPPAVQNDPLRPLQETVLLVEDDSAVRKSACRVLSETGYLVLEAASGAEALRVSQNHQGTIDLLLADLVMPNMTGREIARQLRQLRPNLRVLYISGYDQQTSERANQQPITVLRKPFTGSALVQKVREILNEDPAPRSEQNQIGTEEEVIHHDDSRSYRAQSPADRRSEPPESDDRG